MQEAQPRRSTPRRILAPQVSALTGVVPRTYSIHAEGIHTEAVEEAERQHEGREGD